MSQVENTLIENSLLKKKDKYSAWQSPSFSLTSFCNESFEDELREEKKRFFEDNSFIDDNTSLPLSQGDYTRFRILKFILSGRQGTFGYKCKYFAANIWISRTIDEISNLASLSDDWDGDGAAQIKPEIIKSAITLICELAIRRMDKPLIYPIFDGSIQMEWYSPFGELEISFSSKDVIVLLFDRPSGEKLDKELDLRAGTVLLNSYLDILFP